MMNPPSTTGNTEASSNVDDSSRRQSRLETTVVATKDAMTATAAADGDSPSNGGLMKDLSLKGRSDENSASQGRKRDVEGDAKEKETSPTEMTSNSKGPVGATVKSPGNTTNSAGHSQSPMTLVNLGSAAARARRDMMTGPSPSSRRRNSSVGDVLGTQSRASELLSTALARECHAATSAAAKAGDDLGYNATEDLGYGVEEEPQPRSYRQQMQRPAKRQCRYQRRNSFVIPETSRAAGQAPGFSWKAMDFLYGGPPSSSSSVGGGGSGTKGLEQASVEMLRRFGSLPAVQETSK